MNGISIAAFIKGKLSILLLLLFIMLSACSGRQVNYREYQCQEKVRSKIPVKPKPAEKRIPCSPPFQATPLIIIDPGHGGDDFGTHSSSKPKYQEKNLNLTTARFLKSYLDQMGYRTHMTRVKDVFIPLDKRAEIANEKNPQLFVSVHYNSAPSTQAEGIEIYYFRSDEDKVRTKESQQLAQAILDKVLNSTQAKSRGIKHGNFAVIRKTNMPAVLVEGGFLTNDGEMQKIKDASYLRKLAWGIAEGIQEYLEKDKK
jgi:N-acetylmuramoyl-L-alanine amidase